MQRLAELDINGNTRISAMEVRQGLCKSLEHEACMLETRCTSTAIGLTKKTELKGLGSKVTIQSTGEYEYVTTLGL